MPKNEKLITDIQAVAAEKGVDVPVTEGKNNAELVAILKLIKDSPAAPPPPDAPEVKAFPYSVAKGVSITCKGARILADGDEITKNDIPADSFKAFIKSGHINKG